MNNDLLLFVYGTLRRGSQSGAHQQFMAQASLIGAGRVHGQLYQVDYYPALAITGQDSWVTGEVYRLPDTQALARLDDYECCAEHYAEPREYAREKVSVLLDNGQHLDAWVYRYNWPLDDYPVIDGGDFLASLITA